MDERKNITDIAFKRSVRKFHSRCQNWHLSTRRYCNKWSQQITKSLRITIPAYEVLTDVCANIMVFWNMTSYSQHISEEPATSIRKISDFESRIQKQHRTNLLCRWRQHAPPKRRYLTTRLQGVTSLNSFSQPGLREFNRFCSNFPFVSSWSPFYCHCYSDVSVINVYTDQL